MKYCKNCGAELSETDTVCPACHATIEEPKQVIANSDYKFCPRCGNRTLRQAVICPACGCAFPDVRQPASTRNGPAPTPARATTGLVLGIVGLSLGITSYFVFAFLCLIGLGLCIPGLVCSIASRFGRGKKVTGIVFSATGLLICFIGFIVWMAFLSM